MNEPINVIHGEKRQQEKRAALLNGLIRFNTPAIGAPDYKPLVLTVERSGHVVAGLSGYTLYRWMCIDILWVTHDERGRGIGRALLTKAEAIAIDHGCKGIQLDTFDFQAPGFYEKLGYEMYGVLEEWAGGHKRFSFRKTFDR